MSERILIVGAGAIGGVTAAHLTRAGHEVVVLEADPEHAAHLLEPGLRFEELHAPDVVLPLDVVTSAEELQGSFDFALLTLKSLALPNALGDLTDGNHVDTYVSLGNGLVQDVVRESVGKGSFLIGLVEWGATNLGPGHLRQTTRAPFVIGEPDGTRSARVERLCTVLRDVAPDTRVSTDIHSQVWSKLLINSVFSGLGALGGCLYQDVAEHPVSRELAFRMWTEGFDVARKLGLELDEVWGFQPEELVVHRPQDRARAEATLDTLMTKAGATKASMLQDLERGRRTEVDVINGGVVASAAAAGTKAPLNAELTRLLHEFEDGIGAPGPVNFARLAEVTAS
ncbi:ketopantoate reductase family protein [Actinopolymorpha pittospori]